MFRDWWSRFIARRHLMACARRFFTEQWDVPNTYGRRIALDGARRQALRAGYTLGDVERMVLTESEKVRKPWVRG